MPTKSSQDQVHIFLCICCEIFWIYQPVIMYHSACVDHDTHLNFIFWNPPITFANYRYSHMGKHLSTSENSVTSDTIQLLVAIKGNYSGLFFFWTSRSKGEFPRDYLINIAPYLTSSAWAIFYFGQVLVFCELINKNVLGWFLLIMCKEHTLRRSTNLLRSRNHPTLCLWLRREGPQMSNTS